MPFHKGLLPREGFSADTILALIRHTALNPALLLPLVLFARLTKKGQDLSILHPVALWRLRGLLYLAVARRASAWLSDRVRNNWVADGGYDWDREVVLVTGGAGGIGGAIVRMFEERGVTVVVLDVQPMSFAHSSKVHHYHCDIRYPSDLAATAALIRAAVGDPTVVINNAGVARGKTLLDSSPSDVRLTFDVNALALFWTAKEFLPSMLARDHGMVVTVGSYASWLTIPNMVDYGASKAAALAFHEGITAEIATRYGKDGKGRKGASRVRTVMVHPGHTTTELFRGYDQGTAFFMPEQHPESVAEAVVRQVLAGRSGTVVHPPVGSFLSGLRAMPEWYQSRVRAGGEAYMHKWSGRQVIEEGEGDKGDAAEAGVREEGREEVGGNGGAQGGEEAPSSVSEKLAQESSAGESTVFVSSEAS
ncbi:hypothetical protein N3K66_001396 [Trichothecium roseum]|uniref:Uncharacterized protein n=1 Tax=Trichothecium roseum TaxID=47278 RepID=A0ACC0VG46_9HYPO|nr:hypothetical protein N3K66_001396 [Trichothecium roseum]